MTSGHPHYAIHQTLDAAATAIEQKMIAWRRDIHQNPELGNEERRTAKLVVDHLKALGYEVTEGVAVTGVIGLLKGDGGDGPVLALRADMDALPVTEDVDLPFASKVRTTYLGEEVGVMHACGHDCHTAIMMAVAEVFAQHKAELKGTIKFLFQPAEEGLPNDEIGGARLMVEQGAMENPKPDAVFGLHVLSDLTAGELWYLGGPVTASADMFKIAVRGKQTHGAAPWSGVDPIVVAAELVGALQTLISRETNVVDSPAVLTVGTIKGGIRANIVPETVEMTGSMRTFDEETRQRLKLRVMELSQKIANAMNATAEAVWEDGGYPPIIADKALVERMVPSFVRAVGDKARLGVKIPASDDFAYFAQKAPGFFLFLGGATPGTESTAADHHSPKFFIDESSLIYGLRAMLHAVADFTGSGQPA